MVENYYKKSLPRILSENRFEKSRYRAFWNGWNRRVAMGKEFEIKECIEVPMELSEDEFWHKFIDFIESNNWYVGGA